MILPVLQYPDERLTLKSVEIEEVTPEIIELAADMAETMYARSGIGLAAPQVGKQIRLVVTDITGPDHREQLMTFINPKLVLSGEEIEWEEGCLSVPDGFTSNVKRRENVKIEAIGLDGKPFECEADGLHAICLQHECDHLDGILFIDHISRLKRNMYDRKLKKKGKR